MVSQIRFYNGKRPITSYGIIAYKEIQEGEYQFLIIRRKDTMGYIDILRGKYPSKDTDKHIQILLEEITNGEKKRLVELSFEELWDDLWCNHDSSIYNNHYRNAKRKYENLDIKNRINLNEPQQWDEQEYEFPKGRKKDRESGFNCALREFTEETGISADSLRVDNRPFFTEEFVGSNGICYKHVYYIAKIKDDVSPVLNTGNMIQMSEVSKVGLYTYKESMNLFRSYSVMKRAVLTEINNYLKNNKKELSWRRRT